LSEKAMYARGWKGLMAKVAFKPPTKKESKAKK
jgi:hypothetical protein